MTTAADALEGLTWDPPGPGTWDLDKVHWSRPATAHMREMLPWFGEGFASSARDYGWLVAEYNLRPVNGFVYSHIALAPFEEFPERFEACERAFATKRWRSELERWDTTAKPAAMEAHRSLLGVEPSELSVDDLAVYLHRCREHHRAMWVQHHTFNGTQMIPVGDFLVATTAWTGLPGAQVAALLRGSSPISRGSCPEADALAAAIRATAGAADVLMGDDEPQTILSRLRSLDDELTHALDEWLLITENRPVDGFDVAEPTGAELPAIVVQCVRRTLQPPAVDRGDEVAAVRARVPAEHRDDFDERLEEARLGYRIRDERGIFSDALACGIMRRAMIAAGRRLVLDGVLPDRELAVHATVDELDALLHGDSALAGALEARADYRRSLTVTDAPDRLGDPPPGPPRLDGLPPAVARMMAALIRVNDDQAGAGTTKADETGQRVLHGVGANAGTHTGVARVVHSPEEFDRLEEGDVLITITTGEAFNIAISMVSALVTDQGALMSHAAITAREFGIPCVVGAAVATAQVPDGAVVEVDGEAGTIRWS